MTDITLTTDLQDQRNEIEAKENKKRKRASQSTPTANKKSRKSTNKIVEDDFCYKCQDLYEDSSRMLKDLWVGCETEDCPQWCCPKHLESGFDYDADYYCDACL